MEHDLFALFAEYSGLPEAEVRKAAANFAAYNQYHWESCPGDTWEERAAQFYGQATGYVFDLIHSNRSKAHLVDIYRHYGHWGWFQRAGREVLEFGGGLGLGCSLFRDMGRQVTYVDVDGPPSRFARWYFERTNQRDIEVLLTDPRRLQLPACRQWDFVFSDSAVEHLVDPVGTVETLARAVRPGGVLYLIIDAHTVDPRFPMRRHVHVRELLEGAPSLARMQHVLHQDDTVNVFRQPASSPAPVAAR